MFSEVQAGSGWRILRREPGFEWTPGLLGKIGSYLVLDAGGRADVFAFMYPLLDAGGLVEQDEDRLAEEALAAVRNAIAGGALSGGDHTYERRSDLWQEVAAPAWWVSLNR